MPRAHEVNGVILCLEAGEQRQEAGDDLVALHKRVGDAEVQVAESECLCLQTTDCEVGKTVTGRHRLFTARLGHQVKRNPHPNLAAAGRTPG